MGGPSGGSSAGDPRLPPASLVSPGGRAATHQPHRTPPLRLPPSPTLPLRQIRSAPSSLSLLFSSQSSYHVQACRMRTETRSTTIARARPGGPLVAHPNPRWTSSPSAGQLTPSPAALLTCRGQWASATASPTTAESSYSAPTRCGTYDSDTRQGDSGVSGEWCAEAVDVADVGLLGGLAAARSERGPLVVLHHPVRLLRLPSRLPLQRCPPIRTILARPASPSYLR